MRRAVVQAPQSGMGAVSGEKMEPAVKHTYICGSDEWFSEKVNVWCTATLRMLTDAQRRAPTDVEFVCVPSQTEVSIAARSFAQGGMRKCHKCVEKCVEGSKVYSGRTNCCITAQHINVFRSKNTL